jgi:SAM-dependent methyltransferase
MHFRSPSTLPFVLCAAVALALAAALALGAAAAPPLFDGTAPQSQRLDVIYVPTPPETVERMMEVAGVGPKDFVIDLGCGDGRIAIAAAARGARALGVDIDEDRIGDANANARAAGLSDRVEFRQENLFDTKLSDATVITLYLLPELNLKLRPRILALKPGTRVVSHRFDMADWKPDHSEEIARLVNFWVVPARVQGRWQVQVAEQTFSVGLLQRFQEISGSASVGRVSMPLREARLRGAEIEFTVHLAGKPTVFRGSVDGKTMWGTAADGTEWKATRTAQ